MSSCHTFVCGLPRGGNAYNMISHIVGGAIGVAALVLCIVRSALRHNGYGLAGSIVFGVSMILLVCVLSAAVIAAGRMYTTWKWEK